MGIPDNWKLVVSDDGRRIQKADGSDWLWLGDTVWALFIRLNREEIDDYLRRRAEQRFTVIQTVAVMGYSFPWNAPNAYGEVPFIDGDESRPNDRFWEHADYIIDRARHFGLYVALLPAWGSFWGEHATPVYARWIAQRYRGRDNVIWVNGGDRKVDSDEDRRMFNEIGSVLHEVCPDHLATFHPRGGDPSSNHFHKEPWLDLNMIQSSHGRRDIRADDSIDSDWQMTPAKPALDGEPCYERHPIGWKWGTGEMQPCDVRQLAYWTIFAGAAGITYGHVCVWLLNDATHFYYPDHHNSISPNLDWRDEIDSDGANDMSHLIDLMMSRPHEGRRPAQEILLDELSGAVRIRSTLGDGYAFAYTSRGNDLCVDLDRLPWDTNRCWWYDPRTGRPDEIQGVPSSGSYTFRPPGITGRDFDWVLVIDDASKAYGVPGAQHG